MQIRSLPPGDAEVAACLAHTLGAVDQVRLGELLDVSSFPALAARIDGRVVGAVTWRQDGDGPRAELVALGVDDGFRRRGVGGALIEAVASAAFEAGRTIVWLVTTNDNIGALALYQRHGFHLSELRVDAVAASRRLKPAIPLVAANGIPMRDELVLERRLGTG